MYKIQLLDEKGHLLKEAIHEERVYLAYENELPKGGKIVFQAPQDKQYVFVKVDKTIDKALVYLEKGIMIYKLPTEKQDIRALPEFAFQGTKHYFSLEKANENEVKQYRNVALNPVDQKDAIGVYPHAHANVETRDESVFFASNAIDGICVTDGHGPWPYQSWGINRQADAEITVEFGTEVLIDKIGLVLRADYPHDSYWTEVTLTLSNGQHYKLETTNSPSVQYFDIPKLQVNSIKLSNLIKHHDDSPFPALIEVEVYGNVI